MIVVCCWWFIALKSESHTVDGRNPTPVDMVNILSFTRFHTSQVVQDFFHQQKSVSKEISRKSTKTEGPV